MVIGFLPLDTRPCTYDMPVQLARQAGARVLVPAREMMGFYKKGSDTGTVAGWLEETAAGCDALVVSAEQLLYGGLLQSRQAETELQELLERLQTLRRIKEKTPSLTIYLSNVLMRTSISTLDPQTLAWWEKVSVYSEMYYREKFLDDSEAAKRRTALEREIPAEVLDMFFRARRTNHEVNRECIRLAAEGTIDELLILQEDCTQEGVQRLEQKILYSDMETSGVSDRVFLLNGTDEAGAELLQRAIRPQGDEVETVWLGGRPDFVANYEDRPFRENLAGHMRALSIQERKGAEKVLFILAPRERQREASLPRGEAEHDYTGEELEAFCRKIKACREEGRGCYLLDLDFSNGGNTAMLACLARIMPIRELRGYSAWNTASNSLGMILAQILAGDGRNDEENRTFTAERILDDGVYQEIVRQRVAERIKSCGGDIYNIQDIARAESWLAEEFKREDPLLQEIFGGRVPEFEAKLRWPRLFEAAVFLKADSGGDP